MGFADDPAEDSGAPDAAGVPALLSGCGSCACFLEQAIEQLDGLVRN